MFSSIGHEVILFLLAGVRGLITDVCRVRMGGSLRHLRVGLFACDHRDINIRDYYVA